MGWLVKRRLKSLKPEVKIKAINSLAKHPSKDTFDILKEIIISKSDHSIRWAAVKAVYKIDKQWLQDKDFRKTALHITKKEEREFENSDFIKKNMEEYLYYSLLERQGKLVSDFQRKIFKSTTKLVEFFKERKDEISNIKAEFEKCPICGTEKYYNIKTGRCVSCRKKKAAKNAKNKAHTNTELHPECLRAYNEGENNPERGIKILDGLLSQEPNANGAYNVYGQLSMKMGDLTTAKDAFERSIAGSPNSDHRHDWAYLSLITGLLGNLSLARDLAKKAETIKIQHDFANTIREAYISWRREKGETKSRLMKYI